MTDIFPGQRPIVSRARPMLPWIALKNCEPLPMEQWHDDMLSMMEHFWGESAKRRHSGWRSMHYWNQKARAEMTARRLRRG